MVEFDADRCLGKYFSILALALCGLWGAVSTR